MTLEWWQSFEVLQYTKKPGHNQTYLESIPDVAKPEHEIVTELGLLQQLRMLCLDIFLISKHVRDMK